MGTKQIKLKDSNNIELKSGDKVYVSVKGYFGQICNVENNKINFSPVRCCVYPKYMDFNIKKI